MMRGAKSTYWGAVKEGLLTMAGGLIISWRHFKDALLKKRRKSIGISSSNYFDQDTGVFTNLYPHEALPVPDNGRYRLHNEIEDCIVCDKCAKVCPVDCIDIEAVKSPAEIRKASDGSSIRLYAAKFDIDMAKCCYCGLCTTVCPTDCLSMTKTFDFSEFDIRDMVYEYSEMTPAEVADKKETYAAYQASKPSPKTSKASDQKPSVVVKPKSSGSLKPKIGGVSKPVIKPKVEANEPLKSNPLKPKLPVAKQAKKVLKPVISKQPKGNALKPKIGNVDLDSEDSKKDIRPKALKPKIKPPTKKDQKDE